MLVIKLEVHDARRNFQVKELGRIVIANVGGDSAIADYQVALGEAGVDPHQVLRAPQRKGQVHDHARQTSPWSLVAKALRSVGFGRVDARRLREQREGEG